jgi:hypothetical protein
MTKNARTTPLSRRDTLKVCLLPAAGVVAARFLAGCGADDDGREVVPGADAGTNVPPQADAAAASPSLDASSTSTSPSVTSDASSTSDAGGSNDASVGTSLDAGQANTSDAGSGVLADASSADANVTASDAAVGPGMWAGGGTKSMQGGYPDPFMGSLGTACALFPAQTLGPCYAQMPMTREDISEGMTGLPMRLSFLVVR